MSWKKFFTPVSVDGQLSPISGSNSGNKPGPAKSNYSSYLPDVYSGSPNRIERYQQYEVMDSDPEVNAALDILAEFCTQKLKDGKTPFGVQWRHKATNSEVRILAEYMQQWCKLNKFDTRIFRVIRNTFKYGDCFFIRDPETQKWSYIDPSKVTKVIVNESEGKKPEQYVIKDLAPNFINLVATQITPNLNPKQTGGGISSGAGYISPAGAGKSAGGGFSSSSGSRFALGEAEYAIDAEHIVHLSLSEGLDNNYPFGNSLLENIFKVYKQKELLEDAILIYRIQRAPERRVFHIDVGNMPSHMAMAFVERVKNEIHQRRIPSQTGGGQNVIDSAYNPLSINEDYFFPQTAEGRGSKVETLPGGTNLGEIDDLKYFTNKLFRGLRIPSSYLPTGADDSQASYNDGRVGTAYIQELRFNKYCERLQALVTHVFDEEFKMYMYTRGVNIDANLFELKFNPPLNFASTRQSALDAERINTFNTIQAVPFMSKRFALKRFLGLTDEEIAENERYWAEENGKGTPTDTDAAGELRSAGLSAAGIEGDLGAAGDLSAPEDMEGEEMSTEGASPMANTAPAAPVA
ncbi:portal vertex protein [uncultured Caudovirales phage]|uniref:Portal vertex protein n=1 Tax=uncultured Caudovirales phage TaxID=2100421 RepID=A0A6J7WEV3_9CAUD|nr:portal vertex protein [uncultured Caudovirales phage]CAB5209169.1 portal vertex protein [uncultured Caudovirales phage]